TIVIILLGAIAIFTVITDYMRKNNEVLAKYINLIFINIMRNSERKYNKLSGSSYMAVGFLLSAIMYDKYLAILSWLIIIICDSVSAIIGIRFGRKLSNGKSYIGLVVFFISSLFITLTYIEFNSSLLNIGSFHLMNDYYFIFRVIIICLITAIIEFNSKIIRLDDNLLIPITYGMLFNYFIN
ncbi:MAG TPA: hypothetical protein QKA14_00095, partial [Candidatus Megaira endosymbiont of Hartmannula sinica]|nr:hypothetical protein [Candidatus Megaera endosymbiont of Hartmannula sinica]